LVEEKIRRYMEITEENEWLEEAQQQEFGLFYRGQLKATSSEGGCLLEGYR